MTTQKNEVQYVDRLVTSWNNNEMTTFAYLIATLYKSENTRWTPYVLEEFKRRISKAENEETGILVDPMDIDTRMG